MKRAVMMVVLGLIMLLGMMAATQAWSAQEAAATIKSIRGSAVIERAGRAMPVKAGDALFAQDRLKTGADSYLGLGFSDQSLLSVGPNSEIDLAKYRFDRTTHQGEQQIGIKSGSLSAISGKIAKANPEQVRFNTGSVTLGVRGTEFVIDVAYVAPCAGSHYWKDGAEVPVRTGDSGCVAMAWVDERSPSPAQDRFYLLPGRDGQVGAISLRSDGVTLDVDQAFAGVYVGDRKTGHPTLRKTQSDEAAITRQFGPLLSALPAGARTFTVKFVAGRADQLTPESQQTLQALQTVVKGWPDVPDIDVVGHTDTVGSQHGNDALSFKRAETIRHLLIAQGAMPEHVHAAGRGERQLTVQTGDNVAEEANRRVEITVY